MKVTITDGYAKSANPNRGYHNYECLIEFEGNVDEDEQRRIVEFFHREKRERFMGGPQWCYPPKQVSPVGQKGTVTWAFNYGYDSGD